MHMHILQSSKKCRKNGKLMVNMMISTYHELNKNPNDSYNLYCVSESLTHIKLELLLGIEQNNQKTKKK